MSAFEEAGRWADAAAEGRQISKAYLWLAFSDRLGLLNQNSAREYMVARARRTWGRLGQLLQRSIWCRMWRTANQVPTYCLKWVKVWRPK